MVLNQHSYAAIALICFYIPTIVAASYLRFHRHDRPRMPWIILWVFAAIRISCGVVLIFHGNTPNVGLTVASIILLNAGAFPLIAVTIGFIRIITRREQTLNSQVRKGLIIARVLFFVGLPFLITGGVLVGHYDKPHDMSIGLKLVKTGYAIVTVFAGCLLAFQIYFWTIYSQLSATSKTVVKAMALATPLIIVRITYLFLAVFHGSEYNWDELNGSIVPFLLMGLVTEYAVVCIYLGTGFLIRPLKDEEGRKDDTEESGSERQILE